MKEGEWKRAGLAGAVHGTASSSSLSLSVMTMTTCVGVGLRGVWSWFIGF
jgi:hypothetical protein